MVMIKSKQEGLIAKGNGYKYTFEDEPVEVDEEHADKILANPNFKVVGGSYKPKEPVEDEDDFDVLGDIKGVGKKVIKDLRNAYDGDYEKLVDDVTNNPDDVPVRDDIVDKLKKHIEVDE